MIDLSPLKTQPDFQAARFAVLGLGVSGVAAVKALKAAGLAVVGWDDGLKGRSNGEREGIALVDFAAQGYGAVTHLVLSPGIPRAHPAPHPAVARALAEGVTILSDIDLLAAADAEAAFVGITGTNGKSTTTALIAHLLAASGRRVAAGGNLGPAALALEPMGPGGTYVLECSSYQLETISKTRWTVGVFLNISADHLDRYPDMAAYVRAKARLFGHMAEGGTAVIGLDDDHSAELASLLTEGGLKVVPISAAGPAPGGVHAQGGVLFDASHGPAHRVLDLGGIDTLPGAHNWQNAAAAYAACRALGVPEGALASALPGFGGLRHRQELAGSALGIKFVNDSKATNPEAAAKALGSYARIHWIAGGRPKQGGLDALDPYLDRIKSAHLIGEGTETFAAYLSGRVTANRCGDLDQAVRDAFAAARADLDAQPGGPAPVVLLSPACASWDQFANFEARGDAFVASVRGLQRGLVIGTAGGAA